MKKVILILFASFLVLSSIAGNLSATKNLFKGTWDYQVPNAPYVYSTGKLVFAETTEGMTTVTIRFSNGAEIKGKDVKIENNTFSFSTEVDANVVKVTGKLTEGKISGSVDTPEGNMQLTATTKR